MMISPFIEFLLDGIPPDASALGVVRWIRRRLPAEARTARAYRMDRHATYRAAIAANSKT